MKNNPASGISYEKIIKEVQDFGNKYKTVNKLPNPPTKQQLGSYEEIIKNSYQDLVNHIQKHFINVKADKNNAVEHSMWVATVAGLIADREIIIQNISNRNDVIRKSVLAGLLHDIDRHLGVGETHMVKGAETAKKFLLKFGLFDEDVIEIVKHHDDPLYFPKGTLEFKISFSAVFDADHLRYGLERDVEFWNMKKRKGVSPEEAIYDYKWMVPYLDAWKTSYGKDVCKKWIDYAFATAKHVEKVFSKQ